MTTPTVPRGIKVIQSGYALGDPGGVRMTEVMGGSPRFALAHARGPQQVQCSVVLPTKGHQQIWTIFYTKTIAKGAVTFLLDVDTGFGVEPHRTNIIPGSYSIQTNGPVWFAQFTALVEPKVDDLPAEAAPIYMEAWEENQDDAAVLLNYLAKFANIDTLVLQ